MEEDQLTPQQLRLKRAQEALRGKTPSKSTPSPSTSEDPAPVETQSSFSSPADAAKNAKEAKLERGAITEAGEFSDYLLQAGYVHDLANKGAAFLNNAAQALPDNAVTQPIKAATQMMDDDIGSFEEVTERSTRAVQEGMKSDDPLIRASATLAAAGEVTASAVPDLTVQMPVSIAARIANQDAPWLNPPAVIANDPNGKIAYEIIQVVAPSLVFGAAGASGGMSAASVAGGTAKGFALEAALETIPQRSAEDLIAGRQIAGKVGKLATILGYDGTQLTQDLIEGRTANAQAMVAVIGYFQNLGINIGSHQLIKAVQSKFGRAAKNPSTPGVAKALGQTEEAVEEALSNKVGPKGTPLDEPHEMVDLDGAVSAVKPKSGYISEEALTAEFLKSKGLDEDFLKQGDREYFLSLEDIKDQKGFEGAFNQAVDTLQKIKSISDLETALTRAKKWWEGNKSLLFDADLLELDKLGKRFLDGTFETIDATGKRELDKAGDLVDQQGVLKYFDFTPTGKSAETKLLEYSMVSEEGFIASALIGEELTMRLQRMARQAMNLDSINVDFSRLVEQFIQLQKKADLFRIPMERGKRSWHVDGMLQQRKQIKGLKDADIQGFDYKKPQVINAPSREFRTINIDDVPSASQGDTVEELWQTYIQGGPKGDAAGKTLKDYLTWFAYGDPETLMGQTKTLTKPLQDQLMGKTADARKSLFYASMVSRLSPQQASLSSNIFNLIRKPLGSLITLEKGYARGIGEFLGGIQGQNAAWQNAVKAFKDNASVVDPSSGASKLEIDAESLSVKNEQLKSLYEGVQREMNARGASEFEKLQARISYIQQRLANAPGMKLYARFLQAQDDWAKTTFGYMVAGGRAWEELAEESGLGNKFFNPKNLASTKRLQELLDANQQKVFNPAVENGKIIDKDVLKEARRLTFQAPIPRDKYSNPVDKTFAALQDAANSNFFFTWASPFTKLSYNVLEQSGRMLAGSLNAVSSPVSLVSEMTGGSRMEPGTWLLRRIQRYEAIKSGELGVLAKQQLESDLAFGEGWAISVATYAAAGGITGANPPEGMPRMSFIFPWGNEKGYLAISYEKLDPIATPTAIIADLVQGVKNGNITQRFFEKGMTEMLVSIGVTTVDKSFNTGLQQTAQLFDIKNLSETTIPKTGANIAAAASSQLLGAYGGVSRMVADWVNPYQTIGQNKNDSGASFWNALSQRMAGGIGLPVLYDPLTGEPELKNAPITNGTDWFSYTFTGFAREALIPGRTQRKETRNPALDIMSLVEYEWNPRRLIRKIGDYNLSPDQQSRLSKGLHEYGNLGENLADWSELNLTKADVRALKRARQTGDQAKIQYYQGHLSGQIAKIVQEAKAVAAESTGITDEIESVKFQEEQETRSSLDGQVNELFRRTGVAP